MKEIRPRITPEEYEAILSERQRHKALAKECEEKGIPMDDVSYYWHKSEKFSINVKNKQTNYMQVRDQVIKDMITYSPNYPKIKRDKVKDGHLLVIDVADLHIGKLTSALETGEEYNNQIAIKRAHDGVNGILNKVTGFNIDKILFIIGNDILHVDNARRTTTSGTPQDTDGMWYDNFLLAKKLYVDVLEILCQIADVHVQFDPSNHDYLSGFFLADVISTWFRKNKNITFNTSISHRKYFTYHKNLIGTTHGDGAKTQDLPMLMAHEAKNEWANCDHKYIYTHHVHHKNAKDYMGVCVESLRSLSGTDSWHHRNGYQHQPKAIEGFIHHPEQGQVARLTHIF